MNQDREATHEYFRTLLLMVAGQAFAAAGYQELETPLQWAGGRFRFSKPLGGDLYAFIEFQLLAYTETMWTSRTPSRFRVTLRRSEDPHGAAGNHPRAVQRLLSALVVEDFGVRILPDAEHWWTFRDTEELGRSLAEAGHLIIGYGMPWLDGSLLPGDAQEA